MKLYRLSRGLKVLAIVLGSLVFLSTVLTVSAASHSSTATPPTPAPAPAVSAPPVPAVSDEDKKNQNEHLKSQLEYHKNLTREVSDIKRQAKNATSALAEKLLNNFSACIQKYQAAVGKDNFWNDVKECDDISRSIQDELQNNLYPQVSCANTTKSINDRKRERKELDRQIKDILRNDKTADVSVLNKNLTLIDGVFVKADKIVSAVCTRDSADLLTDLEKDLNGHFQDFYNASSDTSQKSGDVLRLSEAKKDFEKNIKRSCEKDKKRELNSYAKEYQRAQKKGTVSKEATDSYIKIKGLFETMCTISINAMKKALDINDVSAFEDARQTYYDAERDFWDELNQSRQTVQEVTERAENIKNVNRDLDQKGKDLKRMKKELGRLKKQYSRAAKKYAASQERKENLAEFSNYIGRAEALITKIEGNITAAKQQAAADPDSYWHDKGEELNELLQDFNELQMNVGNIINVMQMVKDAEKTVKALRRELKDILHESGADKALIASLEDILTRTDAGLKQVWSLAIKDPEDAVSTMNSLFDLYNEWGETVNDWREKQNDDDKPPVAGPTSPPIPAVPAR